MTDFKYTKNIYNRFGLKYHSKRKNSNSSFWNEYIDIPNMKLLISGIIRNKRVLDIGCGSGIFTSIILENRGKVIGCDISEKLISIAKKENPKIVFINANGVKMPLRSNYFDVVISSLMVHYFQDLDRLFKEINRMLKKNGYFVFSFHHPFNEVILRKKIGKQYQFVVNNYFDEKKYKWQMLPKMNMISYHHTFETIIKSLLKNNFIIEELLEPKPEKNTKNIDPDSYKITTSIPSFCYIKVKKK